MANVTCTYKVSAVSAQQPPAGPGTATALTRNQTATFNVTTSGTGADAVDQKYTATIAMNATNSTINLKSLTDDYGSAVAFTKVRSIFIKNKSTTDNQTITVSPGATNGWTGLLGANSTLILQSSTNSNDGCLFLSAPCNTGWSVTNSTSQITFNPGNSNISMDIEITGTSA